MEGGIDEALRPCPVRRIVEAMFVLLASCCLVWLAWRLLFLARRLTLKGLACFLGIILLVLRQVSPGLEH